MVSTPTSRLRLNKQGTGDNTNTWGTKLNDEVFDRIDEAIAGSTAITVSGNVTLTSTNYVSDQARNAILLLSGAGGFTITIPAVSKFYIVRNACSAAVTFSNGGTTVSVPAGQARVVFTNGTDCYIGDDGASLAYVAATFLPFAGGTMTGKITLDGVPTADLHASTKKYVDDTAFASLSGVLPAQGGNSGKYLTTNGTIASWGTVDLSTLQPLDSDLTAIAALTTTAYGRSYLTRASPVSIDHTVSPYTAAYGQTLLVNSSGGAVTINLPAAVAGGSSIVVMDVGGAANTNNITLDPNGAETISGEATVEIDQDYKGLTLYALAGSWGFKG